MEAGTTGRPSVEQLWSWYEQRAEYRKSYCRYWEEMDATSSVQTRIDGIVMPVLHNATAFEHSLSYFSKLLNNSALFPTMPASPIDIGYSAIVDHPDIMAIFFP